MATLIHPLAISGSRLTDGTVNAGGKIYLTSPGTSNTRVTAYSDRDKSSALTLVGGGYLLDQAGKIAAWVDQPCQVRIETSAGVAVDSFLFEPSVSSGLVEVIGSGFTGINPSTGQYAAGYRTYLARVLSSIATSVGGTDGNFLAGSGATSRAIFSTINDFGVSVKSFGAIGNGVADDTAAIQNTINFVSAAGGGRVIIPAGTYNISAVLTVPSGVDIVGAGSAATIIRATNTTQDAMTLSGSAASSVITNRITDITFTHSSTTTGTAISGAALLLYNVSVIINKFRFGLNASGGLVYFVINAIIGGTSADANSIPVQVSSTCAGFMMTGSWIQRAGAGQAHVQLAGAGPQLTNNLIDASLSSATSDGIKLTATATLVVLTGNGINGGASGHGLNIVSGASIAVNTGNSISPDVIDSRPGAPIQYSFGTNSSVTPLPLQTDTVRVIATAAITVTINAAAAGRMGQPLTIFCLNNSGGAVTWTFNAQYKTSGAVAPATGNGIAVMFEYDSISLVYREVGRSASVAI